MVESANVLIPTPVFSAFYPAEAINCSMNACIANDIIVKLYKKKILMYTMYAQ